jgi:hypothetical protein
MLVFRAAGALPMHRRAGSGVVAPAASAVHATAARWRIVHTQDVTFTVIGARA